MSWWSLLFYLLLLVIPIGILIYFKIKIIRSLLVSVLRMLVQLAFVGLYLEYIFKLDDPWINSLYIFVMVAVAAQTTISKSGLRFRVFFPYLLLSFVLTLAFGFLTFIIVLDISTFFSARYLIPLGGMVLGNILRGNIISLERFFQSLSRREDEYIYYISLGANRWEAFQPFAAESIKASLSPYLATIATMGLVSLPGMMTGQILGGASPVTAIQYQIMIMIAIFVASALSTFMGIIFSIMPAVDDYGRLRKDIFTGSTRKKNVTKKNKK